MNAVRKKIEKVTNPLTIELPEEFKNKKLEVTVLPLEEDVVKKDSSRFFGKLHWKGDALADQKKLQDEWD